MMNVNMAKTQTATNVQQFLNLNNLQNNAMNVNGSQPTARFTVALNNNVNNISSVFLRNSQMSPMKQQQQQARSSSIGLANAQANGSSTTTTASATTTSTTTTTATNNGGASLNLNGISLNGNNLDGFRSNMATTLNNLNNYSINLQNQLNFAKQQQQAAVAAAAAMGAPSFLTAASVLNSANSLAAQMTNIYQPMQQQTSTCNLNNTLFVGNLHASLQEIDLIQVFRPFGRIVECCKKWLHFGFVKFTSEEEACHAYVTLNGFRLKGRPMRLEFQNRTKKARIKAILAQAALQATNGNGQVNDLLGFNGIGGLNFPGMMDERGHQPQPHHNLHQQQHQQQQQQQQQASYFAQISAAKSSFLAAGKLDTASSNGSGVNSFFNADQLIKFAASGVEAKVGAASSSLSIDTLSSSLDLNQIDLSNSGLGALRESIATNYFDLNDNDLPPSLSSSSSSSASSSSSLTSIKQYTTTTINHTHSSSFDFKLTDDLIKDLASLNTDPSSTLKHQPHLPSHQLPSSSSSSSATSSSSTNSAPTSAAPSKPSQTKQPPNDELIISLIKKTISPSMTPQHDLSSSSDSGCRSNSFLLNDEDSAIGSLQSTATGLSSSTSSSSKKHTPSSLCVDELTISEHLEFTCSNSSPVSEAHLVEDEEEDDEETEQNKSDAQVKLPVRVKEEEEHEEEQDVDDSQSDTDSDCDTSDDASEIPTDAECLNELDLIDENFLNGADDDEDLNNYVDAITRYNNVVEKDGTITRKKLNSGIYKSMNQTMSLFIEPHDVLKQIDLEEFNEYTLFPTSSSQVSANTGTAIDSLFHFYLM